MFTDPKKLAFPWLLKLNVVTFPNQTKVLPRNPRYSMDYMVYTERRFVKAEEWFQRTIELQKKKGPESDMAALVYCIMGEKYMKALAKKGILPREIGEARIGWKTGVGDLLERPNRFNLGKSQEEQRRRCSSTRAAEHRVGKEPNMSDRRQDRWVENLVIAIRIQGW